MADRFECLVNGGGNLQVVEESAALGLGCGTNNALEQSAFCVYGRVVQSSVAVLSVWVGLEIEMSRVAAFRSSGEKVVGI